MKAVMLAAGIGWRLGDQGRKIPKCLLQFGGETLLERHLRILEQADVMQAYVGVGYQADTVTQALNATRTLVHTSTVFNSDFERGNVVTLAALADFMGGQEPVLLMDADVLYDARMMARLTESRHENCFLLDRDFEAGDEPVKLCIENGHPVEFSKVLADGLSYDTIGESVGFFRLSGAMAERVAAGCKRYVAAGRDDEMYEAVLRDLLLEAAPGTFGYEDVTGLPWIEIDFPEDVQRAEKVIFPALQSLPQPA